MMRGDYVASYKNTIKIHIFRFMQNTHTHIHRKNFNAVNLKIQCNIKSLDKNPKIVWNIFQIHYRNTYLKFKNWLLTRGRTVGRVYCSQTNQKSEKTTTTASKMSVTPSKRPNNQWTFLHNRQTERLTDGRTNRQSRRRKYWLDRWKDGRTDGQTHKIKMLKWQKLR